MSSKKVLISCGPIPTRLDSVKFITNRFKGGLAFKTAKSLLDSGYDTTIVMWKYTSLPSYDGKKKSDIWMQDNCHIVTVTDVVEYCDYIRDNANSFDAFIMAAAVANLMPSNPYPDKFPSHNYRVGDQFDIKFEIAPRAIDIVKTVNPRCCLIGYKLFDAKSTEELIDIARHTLHDSKANIIFANTPAEAKVKKIAVMQDNTTIEMNFDEHIKMIIDAIECKYFKTTVDTSILDGLDVINSEDEANVQYNAYKAIVELFDKQFKESVGFGTIGIKTPFGMVTTSRGHSGNSPVVLVKEVSFDTLNITASGKATLNAPTLWKMLEDKPVGSYVIHRHTNDPLAGFDYEHCDKIEYRFPGTLQEVEAVEGLSRVYIEGHGYLEVKQPGDVDWSKYYAQFPSKYYDHSHSEIEDAIAKYCIDGNETLEIGGNTRCACKYNLDPNMEQSENNLTYEQLDEMQGRFDFILLRNCINYLTVEQLDKAKAALKPGGLLIANGFLKAPVIKVTDNEVAIQLHNKIEHYLILGDNVYKHSFFSRGSSRL